MVRVRAAVLISGRGSNLQALLDAAADPAFPVEIVLVISNREDAFGLQRAAQAGVESRVIDHRVYADRAAFDGAMDAVLRAGCIGLVCLAGFMRLLTPAFVDAWYLRMINIHPSLLPSFRGLHTHRQALEAGVRLHGCTVHFVTPELDDGPIILQAAVPVLAGDDEDRLAERVLAAEHQAYPLALRLVGAGRVAVAGRQVRIDGMVAPDLVLFNPVG
jgi:phosphoribosylglycinamide formyltransferase-1